ncbi:MAG: P-type conjugative transfer protein TrbL, partial [Pseudomonadota bacterium]
ATSPLRRAAGSLKESFVAGGQTGARAAGGPPPADAMGAGASAAAAANPNTPPAWARRMKRGQALGHGTSTIGHALRAGDGGGAGTSVSLKE